MREPDDHSREPPRNLEEHRGGAASSRPGLRTLGRAEDRCEVHHDARIVHPHGRGRHEPCAHVNARESDKRKLLFVVVLTAAVMVAEVIGGVMARSLALLSDAGHMLTDLSATLLALLATVFATRPATARRTYGYYRLEILAALANGVVLVVLAAFLLYEAWIRIGKPPEVRTGVMMLTAGVGLAANVVAARVLHGSHGLNVRGAYLHALSDLLSSLAVLLGGLVMWASDGLYVIDPILGFGIGLVVILSAYRLVREAVDVLLEAVPADIDLEKLREDVMQVSGIEDVHDLHVWTITSGMHALSAHIVVSHKALMAENDELLTTVKQLLLRRYNIGHSTLQIESTEYQHVSHVH